MTAYRIQLLILALSLALLSTFLGTVFGEEALEQEGSAELGRAQKATEVHQLAHLTPALAQLLNFTVSAGNKSLNDLTNVLRRSHPDDAVERILVELLKDVRVGAMQ